MVNISCLTVCYADRCPPNVLTEGYLMNLFSSFHVCVVRLSYCNDSYLSTAALSQSQTLNLSLQRAQLLSEPSFSAVQRMLHLLLAIHVLPVALPLHLPNLLITVAFQAS